jgi:drug/metabolite transporter (DMT)-like permease
LVLLSALLHAGWNAALKASGDKRCFNAAFLAACALWSVPGALWLLASGVRVSPAAFGCALASSLIWLLYYEGLAISYDHGDLSVAYPVQRGAAPLMAVALGVAAGHRPTALGLAGIALIVLSVGRIGGGKIEWRSVAMRVLVASALTGAISATYVAIDGWGVMRCPPLLYAAVESGLGTLWLTLRACRSAGATALLTYAREQRRVLLLCALASYVAYTMILVALMHAGAMYVVPLRATAVLWAVLLGGFHLGEPHVGRRLVDAGVMIAGITLVSVFGR